LRFSKANSDWIVRNGRADPELSLAPWRWTMKSFTRRALLGAAVVALSLSAHTAMAQRNENPGGGMFRNENPCGGMYKKSKKKKAKK
jgi:hypothetical protein